MIRLSFLLLIGLACALGQYSDYDGPLPPRPVVLGAVPVGGGAGGGRRPAFRAQARRLEASPVVGGGGGRGPSRRLPPQQPPQEIGLAPRRLPTPPPLPPLEPLPARRLSPASLPPRPVIEEEEDDDQDVGTTIPPPTFRPAIYRPEEEINIPTRPQIPELDDFPSIGINRQSPRPSGVESSVPAQQSPPRLRPSPLSVLRPAILEQAAAPPQRGRPQEAPVPQRSRPQEQPPLRVRPSQQDQPQRIRPSYQDQPQRLRPQPQEQQTARPAPPRQQFNKQQQVVQRPEKEYTKSSEPRPRKPTVQVLRKYREDNPDGSITWGFENDDGTFKEETIGVDCVTRGKYGYFDPDGIRREFSYSSGLPCKDRDAREEASEGYIDYSNNRYVLPNGDYVELNNMVKNRARKPVYRN